MKIKAGFSDCCAATGRGSKSRTHAVSPRVVPNMGNNNDDYIYTEI